VTVTGEVVTVEAARHHVANLLHAYVDVADRKDVDAAVALLGGTRVTFPHDGYSTSEAARPFFTRLWAGPLRHRHDVTNLRVAAAEPHLWQAWAHYTRWTFDPGPVLHTLGEYTLVVDDRGWSPRELVVTRTWTKG
jgi:hypothetical protein